MTAKPALDRVAFSPGEFAELFGKSQTWGYRQIYAGKVKAITEHGRILIPAAEVDTILKTASIYDGLKPKTAKTKAQMQKLAPKLQNVWRKYLEQRRSSGAEAASLAAELHLPVRQKTLKQSLERQAAFRRLTRR